MRRAPTLKDIAHAIGVHPSTVSRALDPAMRQTLTADVIERVRAAADQLGYRPNRLAASLRTSRSMTVGVMIPDITNMIFPPILRGVENVLEPEGYAALVVSTDNLPEREARLIEVLRERGVDGIVHAAAQRDDPAILRAAEDGMPVVTVNRRIEGGVIPAVVNDETGGIRALVEHLHSRGHRRIAHIAGPAALSTGQDRLAALQGALEDLGLPAAPVAEAARFDEAEGRRCAQALLESHQPFTAILCANDRLALGAIEAIREAGLRCPEDLSVTGFNDMPMLDRIPPALTTVRIQPFATGQAAARLLLALMRRQGPAASPAMVMPVELVARDSVGSPRGEPGPSSQLAP
jgi:LacI family transcriptional regulator